MLNKIDLLDEDALQERLKALRVRMGDAPLFCISAATGAGCRELVTAVERWLNEQRQSETEQDRHDVIEG